VPSTGQDRQTSITRRPPRQWPPGRDVALVGLGLRCHLAHGHLSGTIGPVDRAGAEAPCCGPCLPSCRSGAVANREPTCSKGALFDITRLLDGPRGAASIGHSQRTPRASVVTPGDAASCWCGGQEVAREHRRLRADLSHYVDSLGIGRVVRAVRRQPSNLAPPPPTTPRPGKRRRQARAPHGRRRR